MNRQQKEKCYFLALKHVCLADTEEQISLSGMLSGRRATWPH